MSIKPSTMPYIDWLFSLFQQGNEIVENAFGRHVHWGYWEAPEQATLSVADFARAAENLSKRVYRSANIASSQSVLDVGCGIGGTVASLDEHYSSMELIGLNIERRQVSRAKNAIKSQAGNLVKFVQGDACELPFPDQYFDAILAVECIFHFADRARFFREAYRTLKPEGYLTISDFVPKPAALPLTALSLNPTIARGFYGRCNFQYTLERYRKLAASIPFRIVSIEDITANTMPTYRFLRAMGKMLTVKSRSALLETLAAEWSCRLGLLRYLILSFKKP